MTAHVFGQRIHDDVRALRERALEDGAEEGVVDGHRRSATGLFTADAFGNFPHEFKIDEAVGRIRGCFHEHEADPAAARRGLRERAAGRLVDVVPVPALREAHGLDAERRQRLLDQRFRAAVQGLTDQYHIARAHEVPQRRRDGRHAARKYRADLAAFP